MSWIMGIRLVLFNQQHQIPACCAQEAEGLWVWTRAMSSVLFLDVCAVTCCVCCLQNYNPQTMPNYIHLHGTQDQEVRT